jgi:hypothetical protein
MKKFLKVLSIILASLMLIAIVAAFILPSFLEEPLQKALIEEFDKQTEQNYILDFSDLNIELFSRSISVDSISIRADSTSPHIQHISSASISLNGIKWLSLLSKSLPDFSSITITEPRVELLERNLSSLFQKDSEIDSSKTDSTIQGLDTFNLFIINGSGVINQADGRELLSISDINLDVQAIDINKLLNGSDVLFMENVNANVTNLKWTLHDRFYEFTLTELSFDKANESVSLTDIGFTPILPKYEFSEARGYQLDRINLDIPKIQLTGINIDSLQSKHLEVQKIQINDAWMEVFRNKQIDRRSGENIKPLLNEIANAIDFSIGLDSILISDATIIYEEHKPPSEKSGSISFDDLDAELTNFRTAQHPEFENTVLDLHVETLFMNTAQLTIDVNYPLYNVNEHHTVKAQLESLDPKIAGEILENVGFVRIEEGFIESLDAEFELTAESSSGEALILYRDLKVSMLNHNNPEKEGLGQRFKDFVANTFAIKADNNGDDPRIGEIDFDREKEKSIFAFWWKSLLSGLKDTIQ